MSSFPETTLDTLSNGLKELTWQIMKDFFRPTLVEVDNWTTDVLTLSKGE